MNCDEVRGLLDTYLDNELDLVTSLAVQRHLSGCPDCTQIYRKRQKLSAALSTGTLRFKAPPMLEAQLRMSPRRESKVPPKLPTVSWRWIGIAAALVGVVMLIVVIGLLRANPGEGLAQQVIASHIRSLMADHLSDVVSSDQHTVKPWFNGKLDYSPNVVDLTNEGFHLIGGRLDYLDNRPVAALVYQHDKHLINLFIWPSPGEPDHNPTILAQQGYFAFGWVRSDTKYWAVSDLESDKLAEFVRLIQAN